MSHDILASIPSFVGIFLSQVCYSRCVFRTRMTLCCVLACLIGSKTVIHIVKLQHLQDVPMTISLIFARCFVSCIVFDLHLHLVLRLRMSGVVCPFPPYAFMACVQFPFILYI